MSNPGITGLVQHLRESREEIMSLWLETVLSTAHEAPAARGLTTLVLRDDVPRLLSEIERTIDGEETPKVEAEARDHGTQLFHQDLALLVDELSVRRLAEEVLAELAIDAVAEDLDLLVARLLDAGLLGVLDRGSRDDHDVRPQLTRGERDEHVVGVGVGAGDDRTCPRDPRLDEHGVVGGVALDEMQSQRRCDLAVLGILVDDHAVRASRAQVACDLAADAAEATHDVMV